MTAPEAGSKIPEGDALVAAVSSTRRLALASCVMAAITLVVLASALYLGYRELKGVDARARRDTSLQLVREFESQGMRNVRSRVSAALMNKFPLIPNEVEAILDYFETLGYQARNQILDEELVWNELSEPIRCYWHELKWYVERRRTESRDPTIYEQMEWLEKAMAVREAHHRQIPVAETLLTNERLLAFLTGEVSDVRHVLRRP